MKRILLILVTLSTLTAKEQTLEMFDEDASNSQANGSFLVPSDLVGFIVRHRDQIKSNDNYTSISSNYMNGYTSELCQLVTKNDVHNHKLRKNLSYRAGATQCLLSEKKSKMSRLNHFGFVKCRLKIIMTDNLGLSFVGLDNEPFLYTSNKHKLVLDNLPVSNQSKFLIGWLSPTMTQFIPGGADTRYNRIFVLERIE